MRKSELKPEYIIPDYMTTEDVKMGTKVTFGAHCDPHIHEFYEIFYILEGKIEHVVNGKSEILETGDIVFLRLHDIHLFRKLQNFSSSHRDIIVPADQYEKCCNHINNRLFNYIKSSAFPPRTKLSLKELANIEQKFSEFINAPINETNTKGSIANILLVELLGELIYSQQLIPPTSYPAWFEELLSRFSMVSYMKSGLNEIIEPFNYNLSYICRVFKKYMGVTMSQYLCAVRLQYSTILLKTTDKTIIEIANDIGFLSVSFFNAQFRKQFNLTPKEYRKLARNAK